MKASTIMGSNKRKFIEYGVSLIFLFIMWSIIAKVVGNTSLFPTPLATLQRLIDLIQADNFLIVVSMTIVRVLVGLGVALSFAIILGLMSVYWPFINTLLHPLISVIKAMPNISIIVQLIILFGPGRAPSAVGFLVVFPLLYTAVVEGLSNVDPELLEMAALYQVPKQRRIRDIYLPSVVSYLSAALAAAVGLNIKIIIGAEYLGYTKSSIGIGLHLSKSYLDSAGVMAWTVLAILTSIVLELPAKWLKRHIGRWREAA